MRTEKLAPHNTVFTVPDAIHARYGSRTVTGWAALAVLFGSTAYLGLQVQAMGILLQSVFGTRSLALTMLIGLGVLVAYSFVGGMVAGAYTDRTDARRGMVTPEIVDLFAAIGWGWGGDWNTTRDWMHFSDTGR